MCLKKKGIVFTSVWWVDEQFSINLEVRSEEYPRQHGPGSSLVGIQDGLLSYSISQEEDDHDQKEIQHIYSLRKERKDLLAPLRKQKQSILWAHVVFVFKQLPILHNAQTETNRNSFTLTYSDYFVARWRHV